MTLEHVVTGEILTDEKAQEFLRQGLKKFGKIVMSAPYRPAIGEVQEFAGLPFRVVRYSTAEEYIRCETLPGPRSVRDGDTYFEVEVAD